MDKNEEVKKEHLQIYNQIKEVPREAQKTITGGRLNGMTDIKPMWRIEKLTEVFGMCGIGWKTKTVKKEIIEGANEEKIAIVDIELYVKQDGKWSEAIEGSGGSSFIAKEKNGLYTSDECFKMAYTDALSVACKALGMGANVYWGDSKYDTSKKITTKDEAEAYVITFGKKHPGETLGEIYKSDPSYIDYLLNGEKTDETIKEAINLITKSNNIDDLQKQLINTYINENLTNLEGILTQYNVEALAKLTYEEAEQVIKICQQRKAKISKEKKEVF